MVYSLPDARTTINLAATFGTVLASGFVGAGLVASYWFVPSVILPLPTSWSSSVKDKINTTPSELQTTHSSHMARQWRDFYNNGEKRGLLAGVSASASWLSATFLIMRSDSGVVGDNAPYTIAVMGSTNNELLRRAAAADVNGDGKSDGAKSELSQMSTQDLLGRWSSLNLGKALFPIVGLACVAYARLL